MEHSTATIITGLIGPATMVVFAAGFVWVWLMERRTRYALLLAFACLFFAGALALQIMSWPADVALNAIVTGVLYTASVLLVCEGILRRSGMKLGAPACIATFAAMTALLWYFSAISPNLLARIYLQNFGYGAILLLTAIRLAPGPRRHQVDQVLFWVLLLFALHFFPRTLLTVGFTVPNGEDGFGDSLFWTLLQLSLAVFGAALALTILAAILTDVMDELRRDRDRDGLTGILNRRGFEEQTGHLLTSRQSAPATLVVCDLDHFKKLNDTHGHSAGDAALTVFGALLRRTARASDVVGRIGGEEFALFLPDTGMDGAFDLAERLRQQLSSASFPFLKDRERLTASFGIATREPGMSLAALLLEADRRLYEAKQAGRNRIVTKDPSLIPATTDLLQFATQTNASDR
ncbi:GGDEF domain-containing protein [Nitratireductor pacificus]|uniref:diguanylate cyclase n=1 Tax=Nitratireductor pacificus pht-3B TaxID=391937 RepID=K2LRM7_9HYPH|nr:GGDEF domain-containing protein [Nitratireductor pacificus]EKF20429.1 diguanylate cyclase [Nitratireductor pacificus pht-3B]